MEIARIKAQNESRQSLVTEKSETGTTAKRRNGKDWKTIHTVCGTGWEHLADARFLKVEVQPKDSGEALENGEK